MSENLVTALVGLLLTSGAYAFDGFKTESAKAAANLKCHESKVIPPMLGDGALYSCIGGTAETVKLFINAEAGRNKVKNVKFMWNDWTKNLGYGVHADAATAKAWASEIAKMYAPNQPDKMISAFFGSKDVRIEDSSYVLTYTYRIGPAINEHLLVITRK